MNKVLNVESVKDTALYKELKETRAYAMWRFFERIESWPTVLIYSPTTNLVKKFDSNTLLNENYPYGCYEKTLDIIDRLSEYSRKWYSNLIIEEHGLKNE